MSSPWAWIRNLLRKGEDPQRQQKYILPYLPSGVRLTEEQALQVSTVWACIDAIGKAIASCQFNTFERQGPGRRTLVENDPVMWLMNTRPNPDMTAIAFKEAMLYVAIPTGNAYAEIVKSVNGKPTQLWPLIHTRVRPRRDPETWELYYEYTQADGEVLRLAQSQVFHLRGPGLDGLLGDNLIARAVKTISVAAAQERYSASFFGNGANPGGVLQFPGTLSDEAYNRLKDDWAKNRQGPDNANKPMILEAGMTWNSTSVDPQKSQLVEEKQFSVEDICRWFGVPPHKVQHLLRATYSNIEHSSLEFVRDSLTPWARRWEQESDYKLLTSNGRPTNRYSCIDMAPLSYGDALSRAQAHAVWRQNGIMSANEIRAREGLNDAGDDGDVLLVQANLTTVEKITALPAPGEQKALPSGEQVDEPGDLDPKTEEEPEPAAEAVN